MSSFGTRASSKPKSSVCFPLERKHTKLDLAEEAGSKLGPSKPRLQGLAFKPMLQTLRPPLTGWGFPLLGCQEQRQPGGAEGGAGICGQGQGAQARAGTRRAGRAGRRGKAGGGGVEEPGPGSLPAHRTRKWRFRWVPERKKQSLLIFFPPSLCKQPLYVRPCPAAQVSSAFSFFLILLSARLLLYFFFKFARFASVFLPFWRGGVFPGAVFPGGCGACCVCGRGVQDEEQQCLWRWGEGRIRVRAVQPRGPGEPHSGPPALPACEQDVSVPGWAVCPWDLGGGLAGLGRGRFSLCRGRRRVPAWLGSGGSAGLCAVEAGGEELVR